MSARGNEYQIYVVCALWTMYITPNKVCICPKFADGSKQKNNRESVMLLFFLYFHPIATEICLNAGIFLVSFLYKTYRSGWWLFVIRKCSYSTRYNITKAFQEPWIVYRNHLCHCPHLDWIYSLNIAYLNQIQITYLFEKHGLLCTNS